MQGPVPCRYCPEKILWKETEVGKRACFDAKPSSEGRWDISGQVAIYVRPSEEQPGQELFESHWASCAGRAKARAEHPRKARA